MFQVPSLDKLIAVSHGSKLVQSSSKLFRMGSVDIIIISLYSAVSSIWFNSLVLEKLNNLIFEIKKFP